MPKHRTPSRKRRRSRSSSSERSNSSVYKLLKKIENRLKAVERKQSRPRRPRYVSDTDSGTESVSSVARNSSRSRDGSVPGRRRIASRAGSEGQGSPAPAADSQSSTNANIKINENAGQPEVAENNVTAPQALQGEILSIIGSDQETKKQFTEPIQAQIAASWSHILTSGLEDVVQKTLVDKYLPPENCPLLKPPVVNPQIKVAVSDTIIRRDGRLIALQEQVAASMSAIGSVLTSLLSESELNRNLIQRLSDAGRMLANIHHLESISRRELIAINLNKELKETLTDTPIGNLLFGTDLDNRIQAAKDLEKSGQQLRPQNKINKARSQGSGSKIQAGNSKNLLSQRYGVRKGGQIYRTPLPAPRRKIHQPVTKRPERYQQNDPQRRRY